VLLPIKTLLNSLFSLLRARPQRTGLEYWHARAKKHGRRAVLNLIHSDKDFDRVTNEQMQILFPALSSQLRGDERTVLDFGCGPGRFTTALAQMIGGSAVGVDISHELISLAPNAQNVSYLVLPENGSMLDDSQFDIVWVCLVLGGIPPASLARTSQLLQHAIRPGGLLFLVENTSDQADVPHWFFRSTSQYQAMFPEINLQMVATYSDAGQEISAMAGRRKC
jgi:SAM-dependent methyltransferase